MNGQYNILNLLLFDDILFENSRIRLMNKKIDIFIPKINNTQVQQFLSHPVTFWYIPFHLTNSDH